MKQLRRRPGASFCLAKTFNDTFYMTTIGSKTSKPCLYDRSPGKLGTLVVDVADLIAQREEREEDEEGQESKCPQSILSGISKP